MAYESAFLLNKSPCAQCGKPIASPLWSERERNRVSFLWSCQACDYQFVTIAILKSQTLEVPVPQESPAPQRQPAIAA
jgi:ribosomal protein L37AE/L43A